MPVARRSTGRRTTDRAAGASKGRTCRARRTCRRSCLSWGRAPPSTRRRSRGPWGRSIPTHACSPTWSPPSGSSCSTRSRCTCAAPTSWLPARASPSHDDPTRDRRRRRGGHRPGDGDLRVRRVVVERRARRAHRRAANSRRGVRPRRRGLRGGGARRRHRRPAAHRRRPGAAAAGPRARDADRRTARGEPGAARGEHAQRGRAGVLRRRGVRDDRPAAVVLPRRRRRPGDAAGGGDMSDEPLVLGIETSCDETGVGIVRGHTLLADEIASSVEEHARYGGVVPEVASRAHFEAMIPTMQRALDTAGVTLSDVDAIAVTAGPGLAGALLVGVAAAKAYALAVGKPIYGVNHLAAHVAVDRLA